MRETSEFLPQQCAKAADRLSHQISLADMLLYADRFCSPSELKFLSNFITQVALHTSCRKEDACICADYLYDLAYNQNRRGDIHYNYDCQQFMGRISDSSFYSPEAGATRSSKKIAA